MIYYDYTSFIKSCLILEGLKDLNYKDACKGRFQNPHLCHFKTSAFVPLKYFEDCPKAFKISNNLVQKCTAFQYRVTCQVNDEWILVDMDENVESKGFIFTPVNEFDHKIRKDTHFGLPKELQQLKWYCSYNQKSHEDYEAHKQDLNDYLALVEYPTTFHGLHKEVQNASHLYYRSALDEDKDED